MESLDDIRKDSIKQIYEKYIIRQSPNYKNTIKSRIVNKIISNRLYQTKDIEEIINEEKEANPELTDSFFKNVIDNIFMDSAPK